MASEAKMLENIVNGLAHHDGSCPMPAQAILVNPNDLESLDWDEVKGVPLQADGNIQPDRFRIICEGSANGIEDALEEFIEAPQQIPVEVPVGPAPAITPERSPFIEDFDDLPLDPYRW